VEAEEQYDEAHALLKLSRITFAMFSTHRTFGQSCNGGSSQQFVISHHRHFDFFFVRFNIAACDEKSWTLKQRNIC